MNNYDFNLSYKIADDRIILNISCNFDNAEYAFYICKGKEIIRRYLYSKSKTAEFILDSSGVYKGIGFVRINGDISIKETPEFEFIFKGTERKVIDISIFGSCTSRDILEFDKSGIFNLGTYVARQSIISSLSDPIDFDIEKIKLKSKFQREQIINDLRKTTFKALKSSKSKYLIIDLIDERFGLAKFDGNIITLSNEFLESGLFDNRFEEVKVDKIKNWKIFKKGKGFKGFSYIFEGNLLEFYIYEFCKKILEIYEERNIIIHRAVMVNKYIDKSGEEVYFPRHYLKYNKIINEKLNYMYDYLEKYMPKSHVINVCDKYCADENHKWGLAPMHYCDSYYICVLSEINRFLCFI